jgi:hypothetical protein
VPGAIEVDGEALREQLMVGVEGGGVVPEGVTETVRLLSAPLSLLAMTV